MQSGGHPSTPTISRDSADANYVVVSNTLAERIRWNGPMPEDVSTAGRMTMVAGDGRLRHPTDGFGSMCAAPLLQVGRCYPALSPEGPEPRRYRPGPATAAGSRSGTNRGPSAAAPSGP
ncbi:hypothetical protein GCM10023147_25090 [Tsukamurella soli]|uniref:Uncharacterized protein n=1 Tax=Tsukamurella soli TaxID=644556 RepID=A0ABP8JPT4_9ACTN